MTTADDLDRYAKVPLCRDCIHFRVVEWLSDGLFWRKHHKRDACSLARHEPVHGGVMYNSDAAEMRRSGPCGPDGALFALLKALIAQPAEKIPA